ncbi:hypothetical protein, partial [Brevibacillus formosus]|uniref:hypothetical protein n=1 Tax=Brevibacillus formosus TaxID=54913 RepID=UPI003F1D3773
KFVTGSKLANHLMIDSLTLSLFSFQGTFCVIRPKATFQSYHIATVFARGFLNHFALLSSDKI